jgi:hypothetical protein
MDMSDYLCGAISQMTGIFHVVLVYARLYQWDKDQSVTVGVTRLILIRPDSK